MGIAQKRQSEKQLEQIRKLDELERSLSQQLQTLEQSVAVNAPNLEAERRKVNQLTLQLAEVRDSLEASKLKADQLVVILAQKTEQMSDISEAYRKCQEQLVVWKKKYDNVSRADPESSEERNEYRLLLMCQSCNNNFKSHCLLKCMHTFCIECIDDIYTSRQRKCPTCAIPFGMQDVKKIFL
ncbi:hypothetical protein BC833DRAFT_213446 [Globomyces pollinis-pini]|nr:hypothetical protein BC833DRAFT_213446 [Globomyces pollinis-pini]